MTAAILEFCNQLEKLADYLVFRFKSTESATAIREYIESIGDLSTPVNPAEARDILGEILESKRGAIKPPQLEILLRAAMQSLFNAMDEGDGLRWPGELILARAMIVRMFDPYAAAHLDMKTVRLPSGEVAMWIEIGPEVALPSAPAPAPQLQPQSPAASHSNSVGVTPSLATSRRVTASKSRNVPTKIGSASTMACAAI